jgi:hypothetical protein
MSLTTKTSFVLGLLASTRTTMANLPDRNRMVNHRKEHESSYMAKNMNHRANSKRQPKGEEIPFNGRNARTDKVPDMTPTKDVSLFRSLEEVLAKQKHQAEERELEERSLSSTYTSCCSNYQNYDSWTMCSMYGYDCESGSTSSHDSGDSDCSTDGLSFIGISFSVNTAHGNPYSYQLNDQLPMENIIDRDYDYCMSMDEDGWLVGGGYKAFDYSGKMPYIDSSHTELLRIGNMDPDDG